MREALLYVLLSSLLFSCIQPKVADAYLSFKIEDTLIFKMPQDVYANQANLVAFPNGDLYYVMPDMLKNQLVGVNISNFHDSIFYRIPFMQISAYGFFEFLILNEDSILIVPDYRNEKENQLVLVCDGKVSKIWTVQNKDLESLYNYAGTHLNRLSKIGNALYGNAFYRDYSWNSNGTISDVSYFNLPHHIALNLSSDSIRGFGFYPEIVNSGNHAHGLVLKTIIDSNILFGYMYQPEIHIHSAKSPEKKKIINLKQLSGSKTTGEVKYKTEKELSIRSDLFQYIVYNKYQERLYVVYSPGIEYAKRDGYEVAGWSDKKQYLLVFTKDFKYIGKVEFPIDKGFELSGSFPTLNGLLCPTSGSTPAKHTYINLSIE